MPNLTFFFSTIKSMITPTDKVFRSLISCPRKRLNSCHSLVLKKSEIRNECKVSYMSWL